MNTTTQPTTTRRPGHAVLVAIAILLVAAVETGFNRIVGLGDQLAFWLLFLIGLTMCVRGPLGQGERFGWANPRHLIGYVLGSAALLIGAAALFDFSLPAIGSDRVAVLGLGLVMGIKAGVARLYPRAG